MSDRVPEKRAWQISITHVATGTVSWMPEGAYERTEAEAMTAAEAMYHLQADGPDASVLAVHDMGFLPEKSVRKLQKLPRIYLQRYPSGLAFWKVRRVHKKHSRIRPDERDSLMAAYAFVSRLNNEGDLWRTQMLKQHPVPMAGQ